MSIKWSVEVLNWILSESNGFSTNSPFDDCIKNKNNDNPIASIKHVWGLGEKRVKRRKETRRKSYHHKLCHKYPSRACTIYTHWQRHYACWLCNCFLLFITIIYHRHISPYIIRCVSISSNILFDFIRISYTHLCTSTPPFFVVVLSISCKSVFDLYAAPYRMMYGGKSYSHYMQLLDIVIRKKNTCT